MNRLRNTADREITFGQSFAPIPERVLLAHARGEVLFVVGAGVSMSAGLPNFRGLVVKVYAALDQAVHSVIAVNAQVPLDLSRLNDGQKAEVNRFGKDEFDAVMGMLERRLEGKASAGSPVRQQIAEILRPTRQKPAPIHRALMRLADRGGASALITTNFDLLLEHAARNMKSSVQTYALGGIPRPTLRPEFNGVLHIHGALDRNPERTSDLIISDQDLGEFYLRRRIIPDLIYDAARLYNLVLVGYSANDPPMRYLLNAVAADRQRFHDLKERFIFVGMDEEDHTELEDWRARGITPIRYKSHGRDHSQLEKTLTRWTEFSAINGKSTRVDSEIKKIVKANRTEASDGERDLFDHFIRRSDPNEQIRLSRLASTHGADLGWLDAIAAVSSERATKAGDEISFPWSEPKRSSDSGCHGRFPKRSP